MGARLENSRVMSFAAPATPPTGCGLVDLAHLGLLAFTGADAESFLHGQLSCDLHGLAPGRATLGSYNTPKGRVLASMLLWRTADGFLMQLPAELAEPVRRRLAMYILRSKVRTEDRSAAMIRFGVAGPGAAAALQRAGIAPPQPDLAVSAAVPVDGIPDACLDFVLNLPGDRYELVTASVATATAIWQRLSGVATPAEAGLWELLSIRAGLGDVKPATQDQFVPQMLNLELVGGVSLNKGCYPGQEIVARTHFLGRLKRRMYRARVAGAQPPVAGDSLFCLAATDQSVGMVVTSAALPEGGYELLAVLQSDLADRDDVTWKSPDGPRLQWLPLPYGLPAAPTSAPRSTD